jgi:protein-tyrosine-phosphatase
MTEATKRPGPERTTYNILFVCTGNTCRSPMALALARDAVARRGLANVALASAGISAAAGEPAAAHARTAVAELGLDLDDHRATQLTTEQVRWADLILGMGPSHLSAAEALSGKGKTSLITDFLDGRDAGRPVPDPILGDLELYRATRDRLQTAIEAMLDRLEPILAP